MTISPARAARAQPAGLSNAQLHGLVFSPLASCAHSALDPDEWFPIATGIVPARAEAEREMLRREWLDGVQVTALLSREIPLEITNPLS
jgi:hypothetical protein